MALKKIPNPPSPGPPIREKDNVENKINEAQQKVADQTAKVTPQTAVKK